MRISDWSSDGCSSDLSASAALTQGVGKPIIDMHLHARKAAYAGENPPPLCAPFPVMPRSDPKEGPAAGLAFAVDPPCANPIFPERTDAIGRGVWRERVCPYG